MGASAPCCWSAPLPARGERLRCVIETAFLQPGKLAGLRTVELASRSKYGATPIDYHSLDFVETIRLVEPEGLGAVIDEMMRLDYFSISFQNSSCGIPEPSRICFSAMPKISWNFGE